MSIAQNNIVRQVAPNSRFPSLRPLLTTGCNWNQGDLIAFDSTNNIVNAITGSGAGANFLGVAVQTVVKGVVGSPYQGTAVDASQALEDMAGPVFGVVAFLTLATGAAFTPGAMVYATADPQTVTSVAAGSAVGIYQGQLTVASAAAGQTGDVLVQAQFGK